MTLIRLLGLMLAKARNLVVVLNMRKLYSITEKGPHVSHVPHVKFFNDLRM